VGFYLHNMKRGFSLDDLPCAANEGNGGKGGGRRNKRSKTVKQFNNPSASQPAAGVNRDDSVSLSQQDNSATLLTQSSQNEDNICLGNCKQILIQNLLYKISDQQSTIDQLTSKLDRILSFLGIGDQIDRDQEQGSASDSSAGTTAETSTANTTTASVQPSTSINYADATRRYLPSQQPRHLSDVVLTAIHSEQIDKDRRAKSVIVNGLPSNPSEHDTDRLRRLCSTELGLTPNIVRVGRLGLSTDRIRPLLVTLRSSDEATNLISRSKSVDRATNIAMRGIYINPNLNKAEAKLAYEERCRRRQGAQRHNGRRNANSANPTRVPPLPDNEVPRDQTASSTLNPHAAGFSSLRGSEPPAAASAGATN